MFSMTHEIIFKYLIKFYIKARNSSIENNSFSQEFRKANSLYLPFQVFPLVPFLQDPISGAS